MSGQAFEVLDERGQVINRVVACPAFAERMWPGRWRPVIAAMQPAQPAPVPQTITRAQGKAALIAAGRWEAVLDYVAGIGDPTKKALAEVALHDTLDWRRDSPFLQQAEQALGLDDKALDELFRKAKAIEL